MAHRKIFSLHWPFIIFVTIVLYGLILMTLPFNSLYSTIFLFTLIAYWSRLPGVGIYNPFFILYKMDVVDIFTIILAIHVGPHVAVPFTIFCNLGSRVAGVYPNWAGVAKDAANQSILAIFLPFIYFIVGKDLFLTVLIFTILHSLMFFIWWFIWPERSLVQQIITSLGAGTVVIVINMFYAALFGNFFENLLQKGAVFNWVLFFFATIVIVIFYIVVFGTQGIRALKLGKVARTIIRKKNKKKSRAPKDDQELHELNQIRGKI